MDLYEQFSILYNSKQLYITKNSETHMPNRVTYVPVILPWHLLHLLVFTRIYQNLIKIYPHLLGISLALLWRQQHLPESFTPRATCWFVFRNFLKDLRKIGQQLSHFKESLMENSSEIQNSSFAWFKENFFFRITRNFCLVRSLSLLAYQTY